MFKNGPNLEKLLNLTPKWHTFSSTKSPRMQNYELVSGPDQFHGIYHLSSI